jgi:hypothetical protein
MHTEATSMDTVMSKSDRWNKLLSIKQQGSSSFESYALLFTDAVKELTLSAQRPDEDFLIQQFLRGLDSDEHKSWLKNYAGMTVNQQPATIEAIVNSIKDYNKRLTSYAVADEVLNNKKGSTKDNTQAYTTTVGKDHKPKHNRVKERRTCWNCDSTDCAARGNKCKNQKSSYCKKCKSSDNWHKTQHHDAWKQSQDKKNTNKNTQANNNDNNKANTNKQFNNKPSNDNNGAIKPPTYWQQNPPHMSYSAQMPYYYYPHAQYTQSNPYMYIYIHLQ